jgi:hypothetical protein
MRQPKIDSNGLTAIYQRAAAAGETIARQGGITATEEQIFRECITDLRALGAAHPMRQTLTGRRQSGIIALVAWLRHNPAEW